MITFSRLGNKGNLGNQLFQIASTIGLARKHNHNFCFPEWKYAKYFRYTFHTCDKVEHFQEVKEKEFNHHEWNLAQENYDINGYLQSEKYFDRKLIREIFAFKEEFLTTLKKKSDPWIRQKKNILITIRRGVFVNNPTYYQLSYKYYFLAIIKNFPDWKERNLIFTSDDIHYCKMHFGFLPNAYFLDNYSPVEQLGIASLCNDFVISNSTFSWWAAWLGEKKGSKVIRPYKYLRGKFSIHNNEIDYFPERWKSFDHHQHKVPLQYLRLLLIGELYNRYFDIQYYPQFYTRKILKRLRRMRH